jgi:LEA14-like dessication related protein
MNVTTRMATMRGSLPTILVVILASILSACAGLPGRDPVQVTVADVESLPGEGLEVRMKVKLRVQNPNDTAVEYSGVYLKVDVLNRTFATGVSDQRGTIPRFGEALIEVPMTVSTLRVAAHALGIFLDGRPAERVNYKLEGKLDGPLFGSTRFRHEGEFTLPRTPAVKP